MNRCLIGDSREVLQTLPANTFNCCITSPPYWAQRDYGHPDQIGLEPTPEAYVAELVGVFREVRRVLREDGTLWLNIGDSYAGGRGGGGRPDSSAAPKSRPAPAAGLKQKDMIGVPWMLAFALRADGWWLRSEIIWHKSTHVPDGATDRPTKAHEQVFLLSKRSQYFYNAAAVAEKSVRPGQVYKDTCNGKGALIDPVSHKPRRVVIGETRNARTVWTVPIEPYKGAHFAAMPRALVKRCMLAGCPEGGAVLDPFFGSGTVGEVAELLGRQWFGCELNPEYGQLIAKRTAQTGLQFHEAPAPTLECVPEQLEIGETGAVP